MVKDIFIIRHGESTANIDRWEYLITPSREIPMSWRGHKQARRAGVFLEHLLSQPEYSNPKVKLFRSPFERTRQTADGLIAKMKEGRITSVEEDSLLEEMNFGICEGLNDEEIADVLVAYPEAYEQYSKHYNDDQYMYAFKYPEGESKKEVAERAKSFVEKFKQSEALENNSVAVIVTHGFTGRAVASAFMNGEDDLVARTNSGNGWIRHLREENGRFVDKGFIFKGTPEEILALTHSDGLPKSIQTK